MTINTKYNRLTVLSIAEVRSYKSTKDTIVNTKCDCGNTKTVSLKHLKANKIKSCGCLRKEVTSTNARENNKTHGLSDSPEYYTWRTMLARCTNKNHISYDYYGGRGVTVCTRWQEDFENFYKDMGPRPSDNHSIDRVNNNGPYEPSNCRWALATEQNQNRRPRSEWKNAKRSA